MRRARDEVTRKFSAEREPVLHALTGYLLTDNSTATVLLGQRNPRQVEAASTVGRPLSPDDAAWVLRTYTANR